VTRPYCSAIQRLPHNVAAQGTERSEGKGGEARFASAALHAMKAYGGVDV
jgi:hypothetical protein